MCHVRCTQAILANPPKVNSILNIKYDGINKYGKLQFPQFIRIRNDVSWKNLQDDYNNKKLN